MPISHTVWSLDEKKPLEIADLIDEKELELLLRDHIEILNKGWLVISNQVKQMLTCTSLYDAVRDKVITCVKGTIQNDRRWFHG